MSDYRERMIVWKFDIIRTFVFRTNILKYRLCILKPRQINARPAPHVPPQTSPLFQLPLTQVLRPPVPQPAHLHLTDQVPLVTHHRQLFLLGHWLLFRTPPQTVSNHGHLLELWHSQVLVRVREFSDCTVWDIFVERVHHIDWGK